MNARFLDFADQFKVSTKGAILVAVPLVTTIVSLVVLITLLDLSERESQQEARNKTFYNLDVSLERILIDVYGSTSMYSFTRQKFYRDRVETGFRMFSNAREQLLALSDGDPQQLLVLGRMKEIERLLNRYLHGVCDASQQGVDPVEIMKIPGINQQAQCLMRQCEALIEDLRKKHEKHFLSRPLNSIHIRSSIKAIVFFFVALTALASAALARKFSRSITGRLGTVMTNAVLLSAQSPLSQPSRGKDEIAQLDRIFHEVAATLNQAKLLERSLIDNVGGIICSIDMGNRLIEVSPACQSLWGYLPEELIGRRFIEIIVDEDVEATLQSLRTCAATGNDTELENRVQKKDRSFMYTLWSLKWVPDQKTYFCVIHDITERKQSEELLKESEARFRLMVECLPVALFVLSPEGRIETANLTAEKLFGYEIDQLAGLNMDTLFARGDSSSESHLLDQINAVSSLKSTEVMAIRKDATLFPAELSVASYDFAGKRKALITVLDATERHEVERFKREFVSMVSHDLRSPLTSLQGVLTMLESGNLGRLDEHGLNSIERSEKDLGRLVGLIDDLLDIDRLQAGKMKLNLEVADLQVIVSQAVSTLVNMANRKSVTIDYCKQSLEVFGDAARLAHVITSLLSIAINDSPPEQRVSITYREQAECVEVCINGQGKLLGQTDSARTFESVGQPAAAATVQRHEGAALAICQAIIHAHRGTTGVDSGNESGTTFWFRIPQPQ